MYAVYELRRSSSLVTPSAVALGESHSLTFHDPEGVASSLAGNLRNLCNLWMKSAAGKIYEIGKIWLRINLSAGPIGWSDGCAVRGSEATPPGSGRGGGSVSPGFAASSSQLNPGL